MATEVTTTSVKVDVADILRWNQEAYSRGWAEARSLIDTLGHTLGQREGVIAAQQGQLATAQDRFADCLDKIGALTKRTSEIVLLDTKKEVAIARANAQTAQISELTQLLKPIAERAAEALLVPASGRRMPQKAERALTKIFESDALCADVERVIGIDHFDALLRWAAGKGDA